MKLVHYGMALLLAISATLAHAATRVIPCDNQGCADEQVVRQAVIAATEGLSYGQHRVYVHNIDTSVTVYYEVQRVYESDLGLERPNPSGRTGRGGALRVWATGPYPAGAAEANYIKAVYRLERHPGQALGLNLPTERFRFGARSFSAISVLQFPYMHNNSGVMVTPSLAQIHLGCCDAQWQFAITHDLFESLMQLTGMSRYQLGNALNAAMAHVANMNQSGHEFGIGASTDFSAWLVQGQVSGSYTYSNGTSTSFSFNLLQPSFMVAYSDGLVGVSWNPATGEFEVKVVVDAEGQVIHFKDGRPVLNGTYRVTAANAALYRAMFNYMRALGAYNLQEFERLTQTGIVIVCEGVKHCHPA
jgi:hypothetical protein